MAKNLVEFMREEGMSEDELKTKIEIAEGKNNHRILWALKRWKMEPEKRSIIYCYDRWIQWVRMRKMMKHHLRICNNMVKPGLCDL
jgi:hypothetical protein